MDEFIIKSIQDFSISLYTELAKHEIGKNMFFSPFSIHVILFLASVGSESNSLTFNEIISTIKLSKDHHSLPEYKQFLEQLFTNSETNLKLATAMFVDSSYDIDDNFMNDSENILKTYVKKLDFKGYPTKQLQHMNDWVSKETNRKINELFPEGSVNEYTVLVLANAMHFKCAWLHKFEEVRDKKFFINSRRPAVNVKMMFLRKDLYHYHDDNLKYAALQLPYDVFGYSMIILLPDERYGLNDLEKNISQIDLSYIQNEMELCDVTVNLPRFKIEHSLDLKNTLSNLGCSSMFSEERANFSKINDKVWVNNVMHKALIDVDENATEAAASTDMELAAPRMLIQSYETKDFNADHPFIFYILTNDGSILFLGRITTFDSPQPN